MPLDSFESGPVDVPDEPGEPEPEVPAIELALDAACRAEGLDESLAGLTGDAMVEAVHEATAALDCSDYSEARLFMMNVLEPARTGLIESVYIGLQVEPDGTTTPGTLNTEHSWPQSQGADVNPARCDLHHLYPADGGVNSRRSNLAFGRVTEATWSEAGSARGIDGIGETVFEPRDAHKGNVARSLLYFAARYDYTLDASYQALLQEWSAFDPPDEAELDRTLAIADEQGAVNPFVVCPWAVDAL
ncbi:MAG: endonuclease [Myxococcota bacterium]